MPLEPTSSIKCLRRRANSLAFTSVGNLYCSVYVARGAAYFRELLEHDLHADAHVLVNLGELEVGSAAAFGLFLTQAGAADLGEIAQDLRDRIAGEGMPRRGFGRAADTAQETLAPRRERLDLLGERRVVGR